MTPTEERDALALATLDRLPKVERRILGLVYAIRTDCTDGAQRNLREVREAFKKMTELRLQRLLESALGKLAAVLDTTPVTAGRVLFRISTLQSLGKLADVPMQPSQSPG